LNLLVSAPIVRPGGDFLAETPSTKPVELNSAFVIEGSASNS